MRYGLLLACGIWLLPARPAMAFIPTSVGGHPGELDLNLQLGFERGKIEPNENPDSFQRARGFNLYTLGVGYTLGDFGAFQDVTLRLQGTYYTSPPERSDRTVNDRPLDPTRCVAPARLDGSVCEFHPSDRGGLVTLTASANFVHKADFSFGAFVQGTVALGVDLEKFANPPVHHIGAGLTLGVHLTSWLGFESLTFVGLGTRPFGTEQNGAVALSNLLVFEAPRWVLPWKAGVKLGPYAELDLNERFDPVYDAAYSGTAPDGSPRRDRIRASRFAVSILPYFLVTDAVAVEGGYVQKLFGYDARATQFFYVGVRGSLAVGR